MNKQLIAVLLIFTILMTMVGCSAANAARPLDVAEDKVEAKLDAAEEKLEASLREAVIPAPSTAPAVPAETRPVPVETAPAVSEPAGKLTKEQAEKIALDHLGFTADQVTRMHSEYEIDDGVPQFDVEFHQGDWEYEFEIHAANGKILSYDKDHKYD